MARQNYVSHDSRDGSTSDQRVARAGYDFRVTGENITAGESTVEDALAALIASPTHCALLMSPWFKEMGADTGWDSIGDYAHRHGRRKRVDAGVLDQQR